MLTQACHTKIEKGDVKVQETRGMKIVIAVWAPFWAGAEVAAMRLGVGLRDAGHDVLMIVGTDGDTLSNYREAGLRCELIPMHTSDKWTFWRTAQMQRRLTTLLRREQPDVIHANDLPTGQMIGRAAAQAGVPRICHHRWVFDGGAIDWLNKHGAERHLFVSEYLMDKLNGASASLAASPRSVVYDGLPLPAAPSEVDRSAARTKLGLAADMTHVLLAGQVIERKGVADALHAWQTVAERHGAVSELHIVGDDLENNGEYCRQMERLAQQLGVAARFHGFRRDVPDWLAACDVVLVPSHVEPLGNATLEAMAAGRPVIGANAGGIPEMIADGETGLIVPSKDPAFLAATVESLLVDPARRKTLGAAARKRCEKMFSLEEHVRSVVKHYQSVLSETVS